MGRRKKSGVSSRVGEENMAGEEEMAAGDGSGVGEKSLYEVRVENPFDHFSFAFLSCFLHSEVLSIIKLLICRERNASC